MVTASIPIPPGLMNINGLFRFLRFFPFMLLQNTCDCQEFYVKSQNIVNFPKYGRIIIRP